MKIRNQKQSRLRLAISPTRRMHETDSESASPSLPSPVSHRTSAGMNFKLSSTCAGNLDLERTMMTRSSRHQSRTKNAVMRQAVKLIFKYKARSISELFDKCTSDEFASLVYNSPSYQKSIVPALELYIKDSLELQRRNRWDYMLSHAKYNAEEEAEILRLFRVQRIDPLDFAFKLKQVLNCEKPKINAIRLYGTSNSGKTLLAQLICSCFITCYANNHGSENEFFLSNFLNKSIVLCEELYVTQATSEDFKSILGGASIDIAKKYSEKQILSRTPVIVTSNFELFGRGHLNSVDEQALRLRCHSFRFVTSYAPKVQITAPSMFHFLWLCEHQDIL